MKRPPIQGMPTTRPKCPGCGKLLRPVWIESTEGHTTVSRTFKRWDAYRGIFCTLRCALEFATVMYKAGYRLKGLEHA